MAGIASSTSVYSPAVCAATISLHAAVWQYSTGRECPQSVFLLPQFRRVFLRGFGDAKTGNRPATFCYCAEVANVHFHCVVVTIHGIRQVHHECIIAVSTEYEGDMRTACCVDPERVAGIGVETPHQYRSRCALLYSLSNTHEICLHCHRLMRGFYGVSFPVFQQNIIN